MTETTVEAAETSSTIELPARALLDALTVTIPFAGVDDMLPTLCAIRFMPRGDELVLVATDRYVLGRYAITDGIETAAGPEFSVPLTTAKDWVKQLRGLVKSYRDSSVTVSSDGTSTTLDLYDTKLVARNVEGEFVDVDRLFRVPSDTEPAPSVVLSSHVLTALVKAFPAKQNMAGLRFEMTPGPSPDLSGKVIVTSYDHEGFRGLLMPINKRD